MFVNAHKIGFGLQVHASQRTATSAAAQFKHMPMETARYIWTFNAWNEVDICFSMASVRWICNRWNTIQNENIERKTAIRLLCVGLFHNRLSFAYWITVLLQKNPMNTCTYTFVKLNIHYPIFLINFFVCRLLSVWIENSKC